MAKKASRNKKPKKDAAPTESPPVEQKPVVLDTPKYAWPDNVESRSLFVTLNQKELEQASRQLAQTVSQITRLTSEAKSSASNWKSRIESVEVEQGRLANIVDDGKEERKIDCHWLFECCGIDSQTKEKIFHPEKKALVRLDTMEVIEIRDITTDDRQMSLLSDKKKADAESDAAGDDDTSV